MLKSIIYYSLLLSAFVPLCAVSTPEEIRSALALTPDIDNGKRIFPLCASCHMKTGWGKPDGSFPVIAGQHQQVLIKQLSDIRSKDRINPTMYPFTDPQTIGGAQAIADVTAYIAQLPATSTPGQGETKQLALGENLYKKNCQQCHGESAEGNAQAFYPKLKGQHYAYLLRHMKWIGEGYRKNSDPVMVKMIKPLQENELQAIADYLSRL